MSLTTCGAGGFNFNPNNLANCVWWIDASDASTTYDTANMNAQITSGSCGRILDKTGGGHDVKAVSSTRPTLSTGLQNGLSGINGGNSGYFDTLQNNIAWTTNNPMTVFLVSAITVAATNYQLWDCSGNGLVYRFDSSSKQDLVFPGSADVGDATNAVANNTTTITAATWSNSAGGAFRKNGAANGTIAASAQPVGTITTFLATAAGTSNFIRSSNIFYEMLVYQRILSAGEISQVEGYLNRKWAVF